MWPATTLASALSALEAHVSAQLAPVRGIERSQLRADGIAMRSPGIIAPLSTPAVGTRSRWASVSESDGGTRLSFPSTDPDREVSQPNAVVGLRHRRASLPAHLRGPCPAECRSSRAPPPCSSRPFLPTSHANAVLFITTRIASMAYLSSLTGMRRRPLTPRDSLEAVSRARPDQRSNGRAA